MIDLSFIKRLIETVESSGIDTLEYSRWGTRIRITKSPNLVLGGNAAPQPPITFAPARNAGAAPERALSDAAAAPQEALPEPVVDPRIVEVTSPMVGTFYRAPAPDADPYVDVGGRVKVGQTLCILEAMKLMNELEAETDGTIKEVCVDNAEPVEYGQILFRILPD